MKSLLIFAIITLSFSPVLSQECSNNSDYAMTFGITDNFKLTNFNMDIAVKKIIDEKHQLRLFLSPQYFKK